MYIPREKGSPPLPPQELRVINEAFRTITGRLPDVDECMRGASYSPRSAYEYECKHEFEPTSSPLRKLTRAAAVVVGCFFTLSIAASPLFVSGKEDHLAVARGVEFESAESLANAGICEGDLKSAVGHLKLFAQEADGSGKSSKAREVAQVLPKFERDAQIMHGVECSSSGVLVRVIQNAYPLTLDVG